jgi:hypothetical protein
MDLFTFLRQPIYGAKAVHTDSHIQRACEHITSNLVYIKDDSDENFFDSCNYILKQIVAIRFCLNL